MPAKDGEKKRQLTLGEKIKSQKSAKTSSNNFEPNPGILLQPVIPPPMWGVNPRSILGKSWWYKERKRARNKSGNNCHACGIPAAAQRGSQYYLEGHEQYRINCSKGIMVYLGCVALCHYCHNFIHKGRMRVMVERGQMRTSKYRAIMVHGDRVLKRVGKSSEDVERLPPIETWADAWCLIIGREHYTREDLKQCD